MLTSDFEYKLPPERIAQSPINPRDACRLLVLDRDSGRIEHRVFSDIIEFINPEDILVVNETKVMPARLIGTRSGGGVAELLLIKRIEARNANEEYWEALVRPGKRLKPGSTIQFKGITAEIVEWAPSREKGERIVRLITDSKATFSDALHKTGVLPLPPYITSFQGDPSEYQTVYAVHEDSAAAPTAGLHFTSELLKRIREKGIRIETVDLSVGLDTFRPITEASIEEHDIHSERYTVNQHTIEAIDETKRKSGRVIAVGTTTVRSLESAWDKIELHLVPRIDETTSLYITPGYQFKVVDALVTNFHAPRSTLLALVSAFSKREILLNAYQEALAGNYRFLSFGDAMFMY